MAGATKIEFLNRTQGWLGANRFNRKGDLEPVAVAPGERVFLTNEEIEATEQAHARPEDSPFVIREIVHIDLKTGEEIARFTCAPLERKVKPRAPRTRKTPVAA